VQTVPRSHAVYSFNTLLMPFHHDDIESAVGSFDLKWISCEGNIPDKKNGL
jgi:hypothetical protein